MMAPVRPEMPHLGADLSLRSTSPNEVKVVFVNISNSLTHGLDSSGRINIWLDGKAVGGPDIAEYLQVQIPKGNHQLILEHLDMAKWRSAHDIFLQTDPTIIAIRATTTSNEIEFRREMPSPGALGPYRPHVFGP